jgi:hypothetical protein
MQAPEDDDASFRVRKPPLSLTFELSHEVLLFPPSPVSSPHFDVSRLVPLNSSSNASVQDPPPGWGTPTG